MRIIGIDPGSRFTGYGVIDVERGRERLVEFGVLRLDASKSHEWRLKHIYDRVTEVIARSLPDECAIEMPVYGNNPQSMLKLGRAQAAAMLAVLNRELPVTQYTPKEVKRSVTGNGNGSKEQVWYMVRKLLTMDEALQVDLDASDALAVALCHGHRGDSRQAGHHKNWASFLRDNPGRIIE
ncbi:MAG: crossover junction endodeoxyribonuclease RuvC [Rhodothermales bacterium]